MRILPLQAETGIVTVTNALTYPVEVTVRASAPERWSVSPAAFRLEPSQSVQVELRVRVMRATSAAKSKARPSGVCGRPRLLRPLLARSPLHGGPPNPTLLIERTIL